MSTSTQPDFRGALSLRPADLLFPVCTLLLILATRFGVTANTPVVLGLLVTGVVLLGLPHGSLDPLVARKLFEHQRNFTMIRFLFGYLVLAAACVAGWLAFPNVALSVFLIISAIHFGSDWDGRGDRWGQAAYGFCVISIPAVSHPIDVRQIFTTLGATSAAGIVNGLRIVAWLAILLAVISLFRRTQRRYQDGLELAVILLGGLALPPLVFFVCYFCLLHSPRHLSGTAREVGLRGTTQILVATVPVVLATLILGGLLWRFLPTADASSHLLQLIFIGLAALTVPHMMLTALSGREQSGLSRVSLKTT